MDIGFQNFNPTDPTTFTEYPYSNTSSTPFHELLTDSSNNTLFNFTDLHHVLSSLSPTETDELKASMASVSTSVAPVTPFQRWFDLSQTEKDKYLFKAHGPKHMEKNYHLRKEKLPPKGGLHTPCIPTPLDPPLIKEKTFNTHPTHPSPQFIRNY